MAIVTQLEDKVSTDSLPQTSIFSDNAWVVLCKRYFEKDDEYALCARCGERHETEDQFIERVSMGRQDYRTQLIEPLNFLPNSPTLFNMGTKSGGTLSACFKFDVEDTMFNSPDGIMPVAMKAAKVLKSGGGVGYSLHVRPEGALVHSTHGKALGPLGVMRMYHQIAKEITQGGKRDAAQMAILHCEHPDLEKFIHSKDKDPDHLGTFNISVALTDDFMMKAVEDSNSREHSILRQMAESAWLTGDPGVFFIDAAERGNPTPWAGKLSGTNPCGEVPLLRNEPCNLGSINLGKMIKDNRTVDWDKLEETAALATEYLDDVLDRNVFPDEEIDAAARYTRKLGLGVMGWADMLALLEIPYSSREALNLGKTVMEVINTAARHKSTELAFKKGKAPCFEGRDIEFRNATRTCIAPTGTIAIIANASSGIEPYFSLENTREMGDGTILIEKPWTLQNSDFVPPISEDIDYHWHVSHQAVFQQHTDLAVSKTINMKREVTADDIFDAYKMMWEEGCKGGTVYRDGSRENQVLKSVDSTPRPVVREDGWRDSLPADRNRGVTHKFEIGGVEGYLHINEYEDGCPAEIFADVGRTGSDIAGLMDWITQVSSVSWQILHKDHTPITKVTDKWIGRRFDPSGFTKNPDIPTTSSIADYVGRYIRLHYFPEEAPPQINRGNLCPDCGRNTLVYAEGCSHCDNCGYEAC